MGIDYFTHLALSCMCIKYEFEGQTCFEEFDLPFAQHV